MTSPAALRVGALSLVLAVAGAGHLVSPEIFRPAMPPYLPAPMALITLTGILELIAAIGLCVPLLRRATAWCLALYFVAILPVHLHVAWNRIPMFGLSHPAVLWGRTVFQAVFVLWAVQIARASLPVPADWKHRVLLAAAVYNVCFGTWAVLFPSQAFLEAGVPLPNYPELWQCIGMIVGVYGIGYGVAAFAPLRHWPIVLVGLLGKILGPIGFVYALARGTFPLRFGALIVANDLIWWGPFAAILCGAYRYRSRDL